MDALPKVFISYRRRPSFDLARKINDDLRKRDYDVFLDEHTIGPGRFDLRIKAEVEERTRFVLLLAPDTLDRCFHPDGQPNPDDYVRLEIDLALACEQLIVPVLHDGFAFSHDKYAQYLTGTFNVLHNYNYLEFPTAPTDFARTMDTLCQKFLKAAISAKELEGRAELAKTRGNARAALTNFTEAIIATRQDRQRARLHFKRADLHVEQGSYSQAIEDFGIALQHGYPEAVDVYANRGTAYYYSGDYAHALSDYNQALALDPTAMIYNNRGESHFAAGDYCAALDDFRAALARAPNAPDPMFVAGVAISQYALGELDVACETWRSLLRRDNHYSDPVWVQREFKWVDALAQAARGLIGDCVSIYAPSRVSE